MVYWCIYQRHCIFMFFIFFFFYCWSDRWHLLSVTRHTNSSLFSFTHVHVYTLLYVNRTLKIENESWNENKSVAAGAGGRVGSGDFRKGEQHIFNSSCRLTHVKSQQRTQRVTAAQSSMRAFSQIPTRKAIRSLYNHSWFHMRSTHLLSEDAVAVAVINKRKTYSLFTKSMAACVQV